jgi:cytochrome P450
MSVSRPSPPVLFGAQFKADPYPTYAWLREHAPAHSHTNRRGVTTWYITRYDDCLGILRDHQRFVKDYRNTLTTTERLALPSTPPLLHLLSDHILNMDLPDHARLRTLVNDAFTVTMVERLASRVQTIADELLDQVAAQGDMDLIEDFAFPLPIIVMAELLGVPPEDRTRFRRWSSAIVAPTADVERTLRKLEKVRPIIEDFIAYLSAICTARRAEPRDDLISSLLQVESAGDRLSEEELFSMVLLLIVVGHETSVNLIGNGMLALLTHPDTLAQLRRQPEIMPLAVEELIRFANPVERAPMRFAAQPVAFYDQEIQRGDSVSVVLAAANRDPAHFSAPDRLDLTRTPNRHLGFGMGIHYCLGAPLARLEGRIAFATLLRRLPDLRLAAPVEALRWHTHPIMRGLHHLPVTWRTF